MNSENEQQKEDMEFIEGMAKSCLLYLAGKPLDELSHEEYFELAKLIHSLPVFV